ncbi:MAG: hypothetical protein QOC98_1358 [Frankiaceae bacterium]|nr:hypothetical protein [Frankiaceae bacterium]
MTEVDPFMQRLGVGMQLAQQGDRAGAAALFAALWEEIGPDGDPLHRCALSHWMADVQDDLQDELLWDLRALEAAHQVTEERAAQAGLASPVGAMYPSLHLNLGEVYRRLNNREVARHHLVQGQEAAAALPDDGYGAMILRGLRGLQERLDEASVENRGSGPTNG